MKKKKDHFSGNKGEWSEPYVVLKLLVDGKLHQADEKMEPSADNFAKVLGVFREDTKAQLCENNTVVFTYANSTSANETQVTLRHESVKQLAEDIYTALKNLEKGDRAYSFDAIATQLKHLGFSQLKNPIPKIQKTIKRDLSLRIEDPNTGVTPKLGFSVKSELGSAPTLLNASEATNVIYRLIGFNDEKMEAVNTIKTGRKLIARLNKIKELAQGIEFVGYHNKIFSENLLLIDYGLPKIVAEAVYLHYFEDCKTTLDALEKLSELDAYKKFRKDFCDVKYKRFLRACALGMIPSEPWDDIEDASGGYIIVLTTGEIVAFYVYNRALFDQYLVENTKFERGSSSRHKYLSVYKNGSEYFVNLNLQIRFCK